MTQTEAVAPVISGPSQADGIARFALRTKYEDLTAERRERLKVSILDAVACAINALGAPPIEACRAQTEELGGPGGRCTLIGGGRANPVYATFYNTALIRYVDFMDSYLAPGGLCHPSDNIGAILAAGEHADLSGKDFLAALAVAYQVEAQLTASVPFMSLGFDLTTQLSYSLAAGLSKALGLDDEKTVAAVGICGDFIPLLVARTTPISQWKGLSSSHLALGCFHAVLLASRGVTGPRYVVEGAHGLAQVLREPIRIDWERVNLDAFDRLALKSYNTAVPGQASIHCMLELRKAHAIDPGQIDSIENDAFQEAYDFMGGGSFGPKTDVQGLLRKVEVRSDEGFTARYPSETPSRVTVRLATGASYTHEVKDYPGFATRPFSWSEIVAKLGDLATDHADEGLCEEIAGAVRSLESIRVKDLMNLLARVDARPRQGR